MIEYYIYICSTWRERDADDWIWSRDLWATSAGLSNRISEKKPVKPVCPGLCLPERLEARNNGSRGGHSNYGYTRHCVGVMWGRKGGREWEEKGREWEGKGKKGKWGEGGREEWGSDHFSFIIIWWKKRPMGKPTQSEIASILSFSRWTRIQRNGQCLTRPPANKSPDPTRAWLTKILYHTWRKKILGCLH